MKFSSITAKPASALVVRLLKGSPRLVSFDSAISFSALYSLTPSWRAQKESSSMLLSPMPRCGTLMMRRRLTVSSWVLDEPEIGDDVLDLFAFVETCPGHQLIGHAVADEGFFQHAGLGVGAVHYREVAGLHSPRPG